MAKKKSKEKGKLAREQDHQGETTLLGANVKNIGTALAGVLVGEIVQAAIDRLLQKGNSSGQQADNDQAAFHSQNPIEQATSTLHNGLDESKPALKDALHAVRSVVSEITPDLNDIVGSLKDVAQRSTSTPVGTMENTAGRAVEGAVDTARTVVRALNSDVDRNLTQKKEKKNKKKSKKKNKNKKK